MCTAKILSLLVVVGLCYSAEMEEEREFDDNSGSIFTSLTRVSKTRNKDITSLDLSRDLNLHNIDFLRFFPNLIDLNLSCSSIGDNYQPVAYLTKLEKLNLVSVGLTTTKHLIPLVNLTSLKISSPHMGRAVKHLTKLPKLEKLYIGGGFKGVEKIAKLINLKKLSLKGVFNYYEDNEPNFPTLNFLSYLVNLKELDLSSNDYIYHISHIVNLPNLKRLILSGSTNICDLSELKHLKSLTRLDLSHMDTKYTPTLEEDLKALVRLPKLKVLIVDGSVNLPNFLDRVKINNQ